MTKDQNDQKLETRYLLGRLTEDEETRLEQHYFADDAAFEEIGIAEDELIDAYVRGQLSSGDRERFEKTLVSSERLVERVEFARVMSHSLSSRPLPPVAEKQEPGWWKSLLGPSFTNKPALRMALVACVFIVLVGAGVLIIDWTRLRNESRLLKTERTTLEQRNQDLERQTADQQSRTDQLVAELQNEQSAKDKLNQELHDTKYQLAKTGPSPAIVGIASILLFPGLSRGGGASNQLVVTPSTVRIQLKLALDTDDYESYGVSLRSADRREVFSGNLKAQGPRSARIILCQIPSRPMIQGDYVVSVRGRTPSGTYESVGDYAFHLSKK